MAVKTHKPNIGQPPHLIKKLLINKKHERVLPVDIITHPTDPPTHKRFKKDNDLMVCQTCGITQKKPTDSNAECPNCGDLKWTEAVEL